jgi:hypothetical protein
VYEMPTTRPGANFRVADDSGIGGTRGFRMPYQLLDSWKALFWLAVPRFR